MRDTSLTPVVVTACLSAVALGTTLLLGHGTAVGARGAVPIRLPASMATALDVAGAAPVLLLAAHPQCPCLPATLEQLPGLLAGPHPGPAPILRVLTMTPSATPAAWDPEAVDALRRRLPTGSLVADRDATLARALGLHTSGHLLLFGSDRTLRFDGGITAGRGHRGANAASRALQRALVAASRPQSEPGETTDVFGCPLGTDSSGDECACCRTQ